jgi:hypothetical protein
MPFIWPSVANAVGAATGVDRGEAADLPVGRAPFAGPVVDAAGDGVAGVGDEDAEAARSAWATWSLLSVCVPPNAIPCPSAATARRLITVAVTVPPIQATTPPNTRACTERIMTGSTLRPGKGEDKRDRPPLAHPADVGIV